MIYPCWISYVNIDIRIIFIFIFTIIDASIKNPFSYFSLYSLRLLCLQPFFRKRTLLYAVVIAIRSPEDIADFNHLLQRKQRKNHLPLFRSSTKLFSQKEEENRNGTKYSTHTFSHLNANISLIISQTKKCFGLKNSLVLFLFFFHSLLLIRTNTHLRVRDWLRCRASVYNYFKKC